MRRGERRRKNIPLVVLLVVPLVAVFVSLPSSFSSPFTCSALPSAPSAPFSPADALLVLYNKTIKIVFTTNKILFVLTLL